MPGHVVDPTGQKIPASNGEVHVYGKRELVDKPLRPFFDSHRRVIYINGIDNKPEHHRDSALLLSATQLCPVVGVYNGTKGKLQDLLRCVREKELFNGPLTHSAAEVATSLKVGGQRSRPEAMQAVLRHLNPAMAALFHELRTAHRYTPVFAHSEGNLILSNVLQAILAVDGPGSIAGRPVHSFGSPAINWPEEIEHTRQEYGFTFDIVSWLSGPDLSFRISKVEWPHEIRRLWHHGFETYVSNDPAFVVNRFRTGFGITFNMDEEGLARCLLHMGTNMPRVYKVIHHLDGWIDCSDADDVALIYVELVRKNPVLIPYLRAYEPLVRLLIKVMDEGWTTDREHQAIDWLKTLLPAGARAPRGLPNSGPRGR